MTTVSRPTTNLTERLQNQKDNKQFFDNIGSEVLNQTNSVITYMDKGNKHKAALKTQIKLDTVKGEKKLEIIYNSYNRLDNLKSTLESKKNEYSSNVKYFSKSRYLPAENCCLFCDLYHLLLIGSSLGSIIRKGGMGLPVIIAIVIFIIFYVMNVGVENMSWSGKMNPYLAAWLPNLILLPFGVWMTYKSTYRFATV